MMGDDDVWFASGTNDPGDFDDAPDSEPEEENTEIRTTIAPTGKPPLRVVSGGDVRPDIMLSPDVHETTEHMMRAILKDADLFQRGGELVHVIHAEEPPKGPDGKPKPGLPLAGTPLIRRVPLSYLVDRVSKHARCVKKVKLPKGGEKWVQIPPPSLQVRAVLERGAWPSMRNLRGILEAPALRPDGTIIQAPGFDPDTRYLYQPNGSFLPVADKPTHSDAVLAYKKLCEPFEQFPYAKDSHLSATIAAVLTLLSRPAIPGSVPAWLFDSSAARVGKSLQVDVIHLIATGRTASRMTYPEKDEELEKVLASFAFQGASTVNFDNVARKFGGAALDKCITAVDSVDFRLLGVTEIKTLPWNAVVFASGNNVSCRGDMLPRVLSPRLETPLDNPEQRADLKIADLRSWVRKRRPELVHAALTICRAYCVAGMPDQHLPRWGGFEAWARFIPHALAWVGAADPMLARRGLENDEDPERVNAAAIITGWANLCRNVGDKAANGLTLKQAISHLYPGRDAPKEDPDSPVTQELNSMREAIEDATAAKPGVPPSSRALGDFLRKYKSKPVAGRKLVADGSTGGVSRWRVVPA